MAVLEGDHVKLVDESRASLPDCPDAAHVAARVSHARSWVGSVNVLVQLAVSMRAHGRGGSLLIVPADSDEWRDSIVHPDHLRRVAALRGARRRSSQRRRAANSRRVWHDAFQEAVDAIAGLTAVDGAAVMADNYDLLAFGAKITRRRGSPLVEQVTVTEPIEGGTPLIVTPRISAAPGTCRPRSSSTISAERWRWWHRRTGASLSSRGRREARVHAHRVESLLL